MDRNQVLGELSAIVADSLAIEASGITAGSRLITDLGADSLDFVDIIFRMEKKFGIKVRQDDLQFVSKLNLTLPTAPRGGYLSAEAVAKLDEWLPALKDVPDRARVTASQIFSLISLETLCLLVERKLA